MVTINKSKIVDVGDLVTREVMDIKTFLNLDPSAYQRDTIQRATKPKVKAMLGQLRPEHLEVAIAELTEDCYDEDGNFFPKGHRFVNNGNTRAHYWRNDLSDKVPNVVFATIYKCNSMQEVRVNYNTFDSPAASEQNQEKLVGIIRSVYHYSPISEKVKKGQIYTALALASHFYSPTNFDKQNIKVDTMTGMVGIYIEEIKAFDKICRTSKNWDAPLICSALMSLKRHGVNDAKLLDALSKLDRDYKDTTSISKDFDGITQIREEWTKNDKFVTRSTNWDKPRGLSDNVGLKWTTSFVLYWIEKFLKDEKGVKLGKEWEKVGEKYFDDVHNNPLAQAILGNSNVVSLTKV